MGLSIRHDSNPLILHALFYLLLAVACLSNGLHSPITNNNNIFTLLILVAMAGIAAYRPSRDLLQHRALYLLSLAMILSVASSSLLMFLQMESPSPSNYPLRALGAASAPVVVWTFMQYLDRDRLSHPETVFLALIVCFWIIALSGYLNQWLQGSLRWQEPPYFRNIRHAAYFCAALVAPAFYLYIRGTGWRRWAGHLTVALSLSFILVTGARGASLSLLFASLITLVILQRRHLLTLLIKPVLLVLISTALASLTLNQLAPAGNQHNLLARVTPTVDSLGALKKQILDPVPKTTTPTSDASNAQERTAFPRTAIWQISLAKLDERNIWFGLGPDAYQRSVDFHNVLQPHNSLVLMLIEWGVVGSIIIVSLVTLVTTRCIRTIINSTSSRATGLHIVALFSFTTLTAMGMLDGTYYHAFSVFLVLFFIALMLKPLAPDSTAPGSETSLIK